MRKEVIAYISTNEDDVEVSVQRVSDDTDYVLIKLGQFVMAVNRHELADALGTVAYYGQVFDQEMIQKANAGALAESRALAAKRQVAEQTVLSPGLKKKRVKNKEDEGALVLEVENRGPTKSELKLAETMKNLGNFE